MKLKIPPVEQVIFFEAISYKLSEKGSLYKSIQQCICAGEYFRADDYEGKAEQLIREFWLAYTKADGSMMNVLDTMKILREALSESVKAEYYELAGNIKWMLDYLGRMYNMSAQAKKKV